MNKDMVMNIFIFAGICFLLYIIFRTVNIKEYMQNRESAASGKSNDATRPSTTNSSSSSTNGIAGNSPAYAANIKAQVIKMQDILLISKYRSDYENSIMAIDDLVNSLMLEKALSVDPSSPQKDLMDLVALNNVKAALNNIMSHVDSSN